MVASVDPPADPGDCVYDAAKAKERFNGIGSAECGSAEQFNMPILPSACDEVYDRSSMTASDDDSGENDL